MADGDAHMMVLAVGIHSAWGKILVELDAEEEQTPLQEDLEDLAKSRIFSTIFTKNTEIGWAGTACAVVVFIVLALWWVAERCKIHYSHFFLTFQSLWTPLNSKLTI